MDPSPAMAITCALTLLITAARGVVLLVHTLDGSDSIERDSGAFCNTRRCSVDRGFRS
jgi:hypothetical protein